MKRTVLYDEHIKNGAKMVEFAGYDMPVEYTGLVNEHFAVRENCGVFDVSHMGEILITGKDTLEFVNYLITSSVTKDNMRMNYGLMLYRDGGIVDDLMVYHYHDEKILLVVNASNLDKDYEWIQSRLLDLPGIDVNVANISSEVSQLALQGPNAINVLQKYTSFDLSLLHMFDFEEFMISGMSFLVSRSGYTGEDGFEIYGANVDIYELFKILIKDDVTLCGLGCRDTLRFEAGMPLYGHEISEKINPLEAGLSFAVDFNKDFYGKDKLLEYKESGIKRKIYTIELLDKGIARADYKVFYNNEDIGYVTTGYMLPKQTKAYAFVLLTGNFKKGTNVFVQIRKNLVEAVIRDKKFLDKKYVK